MKKMSSLLKYLKERAEELGCILSYYETLERDKGYLRTDEEMSYNMALAQMHEVDRMVSFIEK